MHASWCYRLKSWPFELERQATCTLHTCISNLRNTVIFDEIIHEYPPPLHKLFKFKPISPPEDEHQQLCRCKQEEYHNRPSPRLSSISIFLSIASTTKTGHPLTIQQKQPIIAVHNRRCEKNENSSQTSLPLWAKSQFHLRKAFNHKPQFRGCSLQNRNTPARLLLCKPISKLYASAPHPDSNWWCKIVCMTKSLTGCK